MDMNLLILTMAIKLYFVYGLVSAVLGFWWAREAIRKAIQKRKEEGKTNIYLLIGLFIASVVVWPYILCAAIKLSLTRKSENLK